MIVNALTGKPLPVYGDGSNIRDWLYVEDHCRGIDLVMNNGQIGATYNIGGNNEWRNIDIVHQLCASIDAAFSQATIASQSSFRRRRRPAGRKTDSLITFRQGPARS